MTMTMSIGASLSFSMLPVIGDSCSTIHWEFWRRSRTCKKATAFWKNRELVAERRVCHHSRHLVLWRFRRGFRVTGMHGEAFGGAGFVNDALEQAANGGIGERSFVIVLGIFDDFLLAIGLIERKIGLLLQSADFQRALRAFVQKLDQLAVDVVDLAAPVSEAHGRPRRGGRGRYARRLSASEYAR